MKKKMMPLTINLCVKEEEQEEQRKCNLTI